MMKKIRHIGYGFLAFVTTGSADAQMQAPVICELHFWPTEKAQTSNYSGVPGLLGSALAGDRMTGKDGLLADLPPGNQVEALRTLDLQTLLGMPGPVTVVLETTSLTSKTAVSQKTRLTASSAPCYTELTVKRIGYRSHITAGRDFGAVFILRRYLTPAGPAKIIQGGADVSVKLYPARTEEERPAANAELKDKFGETVKKVFDEAG